MPNNSPYHHLFHKVSTWHLLNSHKFLHIYTVCSAVYYLLVKTLFLKAVKQLPCFFFCFRVCFILEFEIELNLFEFIEFVISFTVTTGERNRAKPQFYRINIQFYRINTHALKNAFQLQNNSKSIWLAGILFWNLIIQALPKPKLIYLNLYFFLETFKMLKSTSEMFNFSCLVNNISPIYPILSLVLTRGQPIKNVLILLLFLKQI